MSPFQKTAMSWGEHKQVSHCQTHCKLQALKLRHVAHGELTWDFIVTHFCLFLCILYSGESDVQPHSQLEIASLKKGDILP